MSSVLQVGGEIAEYLSDGEAQFVFDRGNASEFRVTPTPIAEDVDVLELLYLTYLGSY